MRNDIEHHIPTTGRPAYCKPRRMHPDQEREAKMVFDQMEREGILINSSRNGLWLWFAHG